MELCDGQTQPGGVQHGLPGGPVNSSPPGAPHDAHYVLPLLLLSPCQRLLLLLLLLLWGLHGDGEVRDKKEEEFGD